MFAKISIAAVAAAGLVAASPVLATGKNNDPTAATAKDQAGTTAKTRYCARTEMVTGSIRQGRMCKTADEWRAEGIDITKLQQRN